MNQRSLFDSSPEPVNNYGYPVRDETLIDATKLSRPSDPPTSKLAAVDASSKAGKLHKQIFTWLSEQPEPLTAREIAEGVKAELDLACEVETIRKRVGELEDLYHGKRGFVVACDGVRQCKVSGKMAEIWKVIK